MSDFLRDLRQSFRMFRKSPAFTFTAIAALAIGMASVAAIFSVVDAVLLRPFPVPDPDRFVILMTSSVDQNGQTHAGAAASPVKFAYWRTLTNVLEDVSASVAISFNSTGGDTTERLSALQASADYFKLWGLPMLLGRTFTEAEDSPHGPHVVVLSEGFWRARYAADRQILGRTIDLNGDPYTVVGVSADNPAWVQFGPPVSVTVPMQLDPASTDIGNYFAAYALLRPGVSLQQAQSALAAASQGMREKVPLQLGPRDSFTAQSYKEFLIGNTRPLLWVMLGAVSFVLLIACANVANLLLVRATGRRREIAIRTAIGAGRGRVIRQLLAESMTLAVAGGALGVALGYAGIRALLAVNTAGLPRLGADGAAMSVDGRLLAFALGISALTALLFGLFPAMQASRADLNAVLKESSGRSGTGLRQNKARAALVVSEVGLSVVLLIGAALMIRTFLAVYAVDPGFDPHNVLTMRMLLTGAKYQKTAGVAATMQDAVERLRAIPGVESAGVSDFLPLQMGAGLPFNIAGRAPVDGPYNGQGAWCPVGPGFFETFKVAVKRGRYFTDRDDANAPPVVVINEAMAKQFWKDSDPVGARIAIGRGIQREFAEEPEREIIGIVADVHDGALNAKTAPTMFVPVAQTPDGLNAFLVRLLSISWAVRTHGDPYRLSAAIQEQLRQATGLPVTNITSMDQVIALSEARQRFNMLLMTVFGAAALLLAAIGIYGLMAYTVEQRRQEIGIRLALGAEAGQVRGMVLRQGMTLALAGMAIGLASAWVLSRLLESLLFGVKARDPLVFAAVPAVLALIALFAVWLPAVRASRVNPLDSLRYE